MIHFLHMHFRLHFLHHLQQQRCHRLDRPRHCARSSARATANMGIKHLFQLIQEHAPGAVKTGEIKNQFGRKVAIVRPPPLPALRLPTSSANLLRMRVYTCTASECMRADRV